MSRRWTVPVPKIQMFFVTAYFGGKTSESNGIALVRDDPKKPGRKQTLIVASDCGGPDFVVEKWPSDAAKHFKKGTPINRRAWDLAEQVDKVFHKSDRVRLSARRRLEGLLGQKLVRDIHRDPLFN